MEKFFKSFVNLRQPVSRKKMDKKKILISTVCLAVLVLILIPLNTQAREECRCYSRPYIEVLRTRICEEACPSICAILSRKSLEDWNIELNLSPECQSIAGQPQCRCYIWYALRPITTEEACTDICYNITVPHGELNGEFRDFSVPEEEAPLLANEVFPTYEIKKPIGEVTGPQLIGRIIKTVLALVGAFALAMFVYGGFTWLTSGGSPDRIKKGKDILIWAVIGLVVIFASYTLVDFILRAFGL